MFIRPVTVIAVVLALIIAALPASAEQAPQKTVRLKLEYATLYGGLKTAVSPSAGRMPKLGLALAGGGAKAAASIGVLKVLAQEGIPVSAVAGTSMGAIVGGLYAAGYSPEEIERMFLANDWNDIFKDTPARAFLTQRQKEAGSRHLLEFAFYRGRFLAPTGLSAGQKLTSLLTAKTLAASFEADLDFDHLPVPFRAVATDIETGQTVVLDHGLLHDALRASAAIPLVFQPVELGGRMLVDGGLVANLPVDAVASMGVDVKIAVDSSTKLEKRERLTSLFEVMSQSISIEVRRESERQAALADLVITPDTSGYSFMDFPAMKDIIRKGEEAARAALPRIRALMTPKAGAPAQAAERFRITGLTIQGNVTVPEADIRYAMATSLSPRAATRDDILAAMAEVFRIGAFSDVSLDLVKEDGAYRAVLVVEENPTVQSVVITGNRVVPTAEIMAELAGQIGRPLNNTKLAAALERMVKRYREKGYLLVRVVRAGMRPDGKTLEIALYEGRVDSIGLAGERKTEPSLIRREIKTKTGQALNVDTVARDIQHLYGLDYFESLSMDIKKSPQGGVELTFRVKEKPTDKVRLGLRYDLEDGFTGLTDVVLDNLTGRGFKLYLNTRYGGYTDVTLGYHSPVFLRSNFVHTIQLFYRRRNYFIYEDQHKVNELDISRTGGEIAFGYQWFSFGDTYLRYRYTADKTAETLGIAPAESSIHIGSLAFLTTIDTRDSNIFAHTGVLFKGSYEAAKSAYGSTNEFNKISVYAQGNVPMGERHTLIFEGSAGLGSGNVPYQEKFGIGGADYLISIPLYGYYRREFVGTDELGFSTAYRYRIKEYQLRAVKAVYLNVALQAANVWNDRDAMSIRDLRPGAGIGLYADSLIGPIRLDFGAGENRRYVVYFSAGFDF